MCIYVLASEKLNVTITNAMFVRNEAEHYGGGLYVSYIGKSRNNNAFVMNSVFIENNVTYAMEARLTLGTSTLVCLCYKHHSTALIYTKQCTERTGLLF